MKNLISKRRALTLGLVLAIGLTGCQTAKYVDSKGTDTIVSLDQINIQDWSNAADQMVNSLLLSGVLERAPQQPAILGISRIVNNTQQQVDTDALIKKIRVSLNRTGKVVTTTTVGLGTAEDPLAEKLADKSSNQPMPYYSLSGKLLENRASAGSKRQVTYSFQLSLTEIGTGLAVWEDEVMITKAGSRPAVGW